MHRRLQEAAERLKVLCPVAHPVKLLVTDKVPSEYWGDADLQAGRFEIRIHPSHTLSSQLETLVHEWAHCRTWLVVEEEHGPFWGLAYAEGYRAVFRCK